MQSQDWSFGETDLILLLDDDARARWTILGRVIQPCEPQRLLLVRLLLAQHLQEPRLAKPGLKPAIKGAFDKWLLLPPIGMGAQEGRSRQLGAGLGC